MACEAVKCILCRAELKQSTPGMFCCPARSCDAWMVTMPEAMARRLSGLSVPRGAMGRPKKTPLYELGGEQWWQCACCGEPTPESEMDVDRCWCLKCKRKSVADTRRRTGRVDRP